MGWFHGPFGTGHRKGYAVEKRILKAQLLALRIEPGVFSDDCLNELLEVGMGSVATAIAWICLGESDGSADKIVSEAKLGQPNIFWEILAKHDPKRFGLDELAWTQMNNQTILKG